MFRKLSTSIIAICTGGVTLRLSENYIRSYYIEDLEKKHILITGCDSGNFSYLIIVYNSFIYYLMR